MATAADYPITFGYGATDGVYYYIPSPAKPKTSQWTGNYHKGVDRYIPQTLPVPIVVNGNTIGFTGSTGRSSKHHLHIGRFINGSDTNPGNGGFGFKNATVTQTGYDAINGNFVRLQADGASWVYCHFSKIACTVGQVLKAPAPQTQGEPMISNVDNEFNRWNKLFVQIRGRMASRQEFVNAAVGRTWLQAMEILSDSSEADASQHMQDVGRVAITDDWAGQIGNLTAQISQLKNQVDELAKNPTKSQLLDVQKAAESCQASMTDMKEKAAEATANANVKPTPKANEASWFTKLIAAVLARKKNDVAP